MLRPGAAADVLLIDRDNLGTPDSPRYVQDLPADSGRFVCDATGYHSVIVNGSVLLREGEWTGARPGQDPAGHSPRPRLGTWQNCMERMLSVRHDNAGSRSGTLLGRRSIQLRSGTSSGCGSK